MREGVLEEVAGEWLWCRGGFTWSATDVMRSMEGGRGCRKMSWVACQLVMDGVEGDGGLCVCMDVMERV